jgi:hypothetical protein
LHDTNQSLIMRSFARLLLKGIFNAQQHQVVAMNVKIWCAVFANGRWQHIEAPPACAGTF